ncbi:GNAT family N-acetyltransferase [Rossellomorea aquimaris]|uniref:GNAT family N-acetyltransferase n=1 Tax=Rossellomorea aquimaris TaxID=189382 RepID=UPI001CD45AFA|nr:GNAT family N-acetyltransferase [Rossellomorea aquimaris]MCA1055848.1 GNAT family N-acetyltransferase [Rossellomorea aquimaris]
MKDQLKIKEYEETYQKQNTDLILHIQQDEFNIQITKEDQPDLFQIPSFYQAGKGNFWIAELNDKVVGTISLLDIGNHGLALRKMFVDKNYRGSEMQPAKLLLDKAIDWARNHAINTIYLGTTPQFLAAHRFYEKNGFVEIGRSELPADFPIVKVDRVFYKFELEYAQVPVLPEY